MEDKKKKKKGGGEMFLNYVSLCLVAQSCPTLFNPMDYNLPGSSCPWGFSRQEYWSGLPCPPPGIEPTSFTSPALAGGFFTTSTTWEPPRWYYQKYKVFTLPTQGV